MPVETVVARNLMDGVTVIGSEVNAKQFVQWAAAGDPSGEDVQFVPAELAATAGFRRALARDILKLEESETDPSVLEALKKQVEAFKRRQGETTDSVEASIDRAESRDAIIQFCVGPNTRNNGECGEPVSVREKLKDSQAPLCSNHRGLRSEFVPTEVISPDNTKSVKWVRASISSNPLPSQQ